MNLEMIPMLSREELAKKFPQNHYCITFTPLDEDGDSDPIRAKQIFVKLTESKAEELARFFTETNKTNNVMRIDIDIFEIGDQNT